MRSAPPVLVPVGRFVWGARWVAGLAVLTGLACGLMGWWYGITPVRATVMATVWGVCVGLSWLALQRETLPPGELAWDGQLWWYRDSRGVAKPVEVSLQWDAGRILLLRLQFRPTDPVGRCAWLQASQMPAQWHGLRCAVHAGDTL